MQRFDFSPSCNFVIIHDGCAGTWATHTVASADHWTVIDQPKGTPIESVAVSVVTPILSSILLSKSGLKKGDTLIQNNAGSTVGQAIIQYAAAAGIRTVNIMRKSNEWASIVNHLQGLGAGMLPPYTHSVVYAQYLD
jgi:NADPH:quinone reductase-like Zn-dependent oxidoreductase